MENLPLHIEYLLTRHDCVILPGIGAFIATESEASINLNNGIITPRRREISFNGSVKTDDGLLSNSIARRENLSYEDARRRLLSSVEKLKSDLRQEGEISIGLIGRLTMDSEGIVCFSPRISRIQADILPDAILFSRKPAADSNLADGTHPTEEAKNIRTIKVPADRYVFTIKKTVAHAAALIAAILTFGISFILPLGNDFLNPFSFNSSDPTGLNTADPTGLNSADPAGRNYADPSNLQKASVMSIPDFILVPDTDTAASPSDSSADCPSDSLPES